MIRRNKKRAPSAIHARLDSREHERVVAFARRQESSVARIIKLAVAEYMNRHERKPDPTDKQG